MRHGFNYISLNFQAIRLKEKKIASEVVAVSLGPAKSEVRLVETFTVGSIFL